MTPEQPSVGEQIIRALVGFPKYAVAYVLGFYLILTDVDMTTLAIIGVLVGILTSPLWGVVAALTLWLLFRTLSGVVNPLAQATLHQGLRIDDSLQRLAAAYLARNEHEEPSQG